MSNSPRTPSPKKNRNGNLSSEVLYVKDMMKGTGLKWAITGSMASKIHANSLHHPHRTPGDIDIVVEMKNPTDMHTLLDALYLSDYKLSKLPPVKVPEHFKAYHGRFELDIVKAGGELAPRLTNNAIQRRGNFPVVTLNHLIRKATARANSNPNRHPGNLNILRTLKKLENNNK